MDYCYFHIFLSDAFYNLFRLLLAYDIIIFILNYVIYVINSHICFLQPLLGLSVAHITVKTCLLILVKWVKILFLIRSFTQLTHIYAFYSLLWVCL